MPEKTMITDLLSFYKGAGPVFMRIKPAAYLAVRTDVIGLEAVCKPLNYFCVPCAKGFRYFIYDQELMARQLQMADRAYMLGMFGYPVPDVALVSDSMARSMTKSMLKSMARPDLDGRSVQPDWIEMCLFQLYGRLCQYEQCKCGKNKNFPHELGIFLGYPTEDVIGFLVNGGKSGKEGRFFKMYANPVWGTRIQALWEKAGTVLWNAIQAGMSPEEAIHYYRNI